MRTGECTDHVRRHAHGACAQARITDTRRRPCRSERSAPKAPFRRLLRRDGLEGTYPATPLPPSVGDAVVRGAVGDAEPSDAGRALGHRDAVADDEREHDLVDATLFLATSRGMPTANAEG